MTAELGGMVSRMMQTGGAARMGQDAVASPWAETLERFGFVAKGIVYFIIGLLAGRAAIGDGGATTDRSGALHAIYDQPFGKLLLTVVAIGLLCYALWSWIRAAYDPERKGSDAKGVVTRLSYVVIGFSYAALAIASLQLVLGTGSGGKSSDTTTRDWTARLLDLPFGPLLVAVVAAVVAGLGGYQLYRAYKASFEKHLSLSGLSTRTREIVVALGRGGYAAQGVVFIIIGVFLLVAAIHHNASKARGVGGALAELTHQSYGHVLLGIVALGLMAFGLFALVEARWRRLRSS